MIILSTFSLHRYPWATSSSLIVWVYLLPNFRSGLQKRMYLKTDCPIAVQGHPRSLVLVTVTKLLLYGTCARQIAIRVCCNGEASLLAAVTNQRAAASLLLRRPTIKGTARPRYNTSLCPSYDAQRIIHPNSHTKNRGTDRLGRFKCGWNDGTESLLPKLERSNRTVAP